MLLKDSRFMKDEVRWKWGPARAPPHTPCSPFVS